MTNFSKPLDLPEDQLDGVTGGLGPGGLSHERAGVVQAPKSGHVDLANGEPVDIADKVGVKFKPGK